MTLREDYHTLLAAMPIGGLVRDRDHDVWRKAAGGSWVDVSDTDAYLHAETWLAQYGPFDILTSASQYSAAYEMRTANLIAWVALCKANGWSVDPNFTDRVWERLET